MRKRIAVAETAPIVRHGITDILRGFNSLNFDIMEIETADKARERLRQPDFDVLIVNPNMFGVFGCQKLAQELRGRDVKTVALVSSLFDEGVLKHFDASVSIYDTVSQIQDKLEHILNSEEKEERTSLSARETEIVTCVAQGLSNKEIADKLFISTHTVMAHRRNIVAKLKIHSQAGLTIYAITNRLIDISEAKI